MTSRLASLLVQGGHVPAKKMAQAFQRQVIYGGTLDTILLEMDVIDEHTLLESLGRASGLPTAGDLPTREQLEASGAPSAFPHATSERFRAVPVGVDGNVVRVLVLDPPDRKQLDELGYTLSRSIDPIVVPEHRFAEAVQLVYGVAVPARFASLAARLAKRAGEAPPPPATRPAPQTSAFSAAPRTATPVAKLNRDTMPDMPAARPVRDTLETPVITIEAEPSSGGTITNLPVTKEDPLDGPTERDAVPPAMAGDTMEMPVVAIEAEPIDPGSRAVVSDVPMPKMAKLAQAAPAVEQGEQPTPRITTRQADAPIAVPSEITVSRGSKPAPTGEATPLSLDDAADAIEAAQDRDAIFTALCRGARSQLDFVALFLVSNETAAARLALSDAWFSRDVLATVSLPIDRSPPFKAASRGSAPYLGRVGEDAPSNAALGVLGRKPPVPGLLVPIVLRERTVALLFGDQRGEPLDAALVGDLTALVATAARSFQRLILLQKSGEYRVSKPTDKMPAAKLTMPMEAVPPPAEPPPRDDRHTVKGFAALSVETLMQNIHDQPTAAVPAGPAMTDAEALVLSVMKQDEHAASSVEALVLLGERGAGAAVAHLPGPLRLDRHALRGPIPPLAEHGPLLAVIARLGKEALRPLLGRLTDPSVEVRFYTALAVGQLALGSTVPQLGQRLLDPDPGVRRVAVAALSHMGECPELRTLTESLRGELPGPEPLRQRYAADALGALRDVPSVPRLIELVKHSDAQVVASARRALVEITKQDFHTSRWRWRSWWDRHRDEPRLEWLLEGLGHSEADVRKSASEELRTVQDGGESFGYHFDMPKREREDARRKWVDWWRQKGRTNGGGGPRSDRPEARK